MATTTTHKRVCRLIPAGTSGFNVPQLKIDNGISRRYLITRIDRTAQGDAYTLARRTEEGDDPTAEVRYVVYFWKNSNKTMCDCPDSAYRCRECKHVLALKALRARGMI